MHAFYMTVYHPTKEGGDELYTTTCQRLYIAQYTIIQYVNVSLRPLGKF